MTRPSVSVDTGARRWHQRLHAALMPDYNRPARLYWWAAVLVGAVAFVLALAGLAARTPQVWLHVAVGAAVAMLAGVFPVRIPQSKNSFAAGEVFIFLLLLMHGPAAAVVAAAGEGAVGAWRTSRRWTSRLVSPAMAAIAMTLAGSAFDAARGWLGSDAQDAAGWLIIAAMGVALSYFVINTLLITAVPRLKRGEALQWTDLFGVFGWVGIAYAGSAAVAALLYLTYLQSGLPVLMAMVPLLAMLLATLHYFFRQQEAAEAARQSGEEAAAREAELAARHVRELEASERRFQSAFTHASIGMALLSVKGQVLQSNPALRELLGRPLDGLQQHDFRQFVLDEDRGLLDARLGLVARPGFDGFAAELRCRTRSGRTVWVALHCGYFSERGSELPCLIVQVQDITARREAEEGLQRIAFTDALTGLPNRRRFHEHLAQAVQRSAHDAKDAFAVMFLDFDRFKLINDSLGHTAGDEFLVQVSRRIQEQLRASDIVARLGGDEFAILALHLEHERYAVHLAERLMEALRQPIHVGDTELTTSASIGITFSAFGYATPEDVLRDADIAMYKAKASGKARYALFDAGLHKEVANRLRLEGELRRAIDEGQLVVLYQPVVELAGGRLSGFEALVRWQHPIDGTLGPADFLPIAEEAGLMIRLTDFVLHCACRQLKEWQGSDAAHARLTMNVNISGHDIAQGAFVARVTRALVEAGLLPRDLCIELTENILMDRLEGALAVLAELRHLGVLLAIDDFGTGYSSLSHLSTLPIDHLKIDRSFVARLAPGSNEAAVVRSIVLLGSSLGKTVVAEGIETQEQLEQLCELGCRFGQGFHLARPMSAADVSARLMEGAWHAADPVAAVTVAVVAAAQLH